MLFPRNLLFFISLSLFGAQSVWASSNGAQKGKSGRPGDATGCATCHSAVAGVELIPTITFSQSADTIRVGESLIFTLDVESNDTTKTGFGFDIAVADTSVGSFSSSTGVRLNDDDHSEVTHQQTRSYPDDSNSLALELTFTPTAVGEQTLYMVINEVNGEWDLADDAWSAHSWTFNVSEGDSSTVDAGSAVGGSDSVDAGSIDGSSESIDAGSIDGSFESVDAGSSAGASDGNVAVADAGPSASDGSSDGDFEDDVTIEEGGCSCHSQGSHGSAGYAFSALFLLGYCLRRKR